MFKSGMDAIEIRKLVKKELTEFFERYITLNLEQLDPAKIEMFSVMAKPPHYCNNHKPSPIELSKFISMIISSLIVFERTQTMPADLKAICNHIFTEINRDNPRFHRTDPPIEGDEWKLDGDEYDNPQII